MAADKWLHNVLDNITDLAEMMTGPPLSGDDGPAVSGDPLAETWQQQIERRLAACESNAAEVGELRNVLNQHEADLRRLRAEGTM